MVDFYLKVTQLFVSFFAALLGIFGNTYENGKITRNGKIAFSLGLVALIVGVILERNSYVKEQTEKAEADTLAKQQLRKNDSTSRKQLEHYEAEIKNFEKIIGQTQQLQDNEILVIDSLRNISQSQKRLFKKNLELVDLSKTTLETTTGGKSFCYFTMRISDPTDGTEGFLAVTNKGPYTLFNVETTMISMNSINQLRRYKQANPNVSREMMNLALRQRSKYFKIGDVSVSEDTLINKSVYASSEPIMLFGDSDIGYYFEIYARNGVWYEELRVHRTQEGGIIKCSNAVKIFSERDGKGSINRKVKYFIDNDFPKDKIKWEY